MHPPLLLSRLLVVFDYILRNFFEPSNELLEKVKKIFITNDNSKSAIIIKKYSDSDTYENYVESLEKAYETERQKLILNPSQIVFFRPRYYLITKTKTKSIESLQEAKLDGIAVNILLSSSNNKDEQKMDYNSLYSSLLKLLDAGVKLVDKKSSTNLEVRISIKIKFSFINYYFFI